MDHMQMVESGWLPVRNTLPGWVTRSSSQPTLPTLPRPSPPPTLSLRVKRRTENIRKRAAHNLMKRWSLDSYLKSGPNTHEINGNNNSVDLSVGSVSSSLDSANSHLHYPQSFPTDGVLHEEVETTFPEPSPPLQSTHSLPCNINYYLDEAGGAYQAEVNDGEEVDGIFTKPSIKKNGEKGSSKLRSVKQKKSKQKEGYAHRSKSLTQIDCLDTTGPMVRRSNELDSAKSEPETSPCSPGSSPSSGGILLVPPNGLVACSSGQQSGGHPTASSSEDLSRSSGRNVYKSQKVPSQELFSVTFDEWDDRGQYDVLQAAKGVLLREALQGSLEKRGIDVSNINVYLDSSNTPLSLQFETFRLGGNHLHVRARDTTDITSITRANSTGSSGALAGNSRLQAGRSNSTNASFHPKDDKAKKVSAGSQRTRRNALMSADELVSEGGQSAFAHQITAGSKSRPPLNRKTGIFTNPFKTDRENMEQMAELLNQYSHQGIPESPGVLSFDPADGGERTNREEDPYSLEDHWSQFVSNAQELSKRTRNQQDAIWEMLQTEVFYIRRLTVISDLFLKCMCNLQSEYILNEIDTEKMFSNISEIYSANQLFWMNHLLPMLNASRASHDPLNPLLLKEGFLQFDQIFQSYIRYCLEHQSCLNYVKDRHKDNELFKAFVAWCETQKDCDRLRLVDLLVKPVQRLTKYSLLLKAIHKKTDCEELKAALLEMNESVENFVLSVDATMRQRSEQERLSSIIARIESYDAIDTNNDELDRALKEHCVLDLTCPMPGCGNQQSRQLLLEGPGLKLRESSLSKVDVHCFLFTDMLLVCKAKKGDKVRVIRQPYVVDRLVIAELRDGSGMLIVYLNEYRVATAAFILYTPDTKYWIDNIRKAQEQYVEAKASAASLRQSLGFLKASEDEEDYDYQSTSRMQVARSARSSSHSSLVHSHSGSVDMSDPLSNASMALSVGPPLTTSPVSHHGGPQGKAVSIELGELRNASLNTEDVELARMRSSSVETRVSVTVTSPRPERRAFLLRGNGGGGPSSPSSTSVSPTASMSSSTTALSLSVPCLDGVFEDNSLPTIQLPVIPPPSKNLSCASRLVTLSPRSLQRVAPINAKPPLVKTKNISGLVTHSAPPSEGTSPVHILEGCIGGDPMAQGASGSSSNYRCTIPNSASLEETTVTTSGHISLAEMDEETIRKLNAKRACRNERRYHTADSIENMKKEKDTSIHKRLSWNCGQQHQQTSQQHHFYHSGNSMTSQQGSGPSERLLRNKHVAKCLSSESIYSSSGVSSTSSMHFSVGSADYDGLDILEEPLSFTDSDIRSREFQLLDPEIGESNTDENFGIDCGATANVRSTRSTLSDPGSVMEAMEGGFHHRQTSDPQPISARSQQPPPVPPRTLSVHKAPSNIKIDVSEVKEGISSVQITVNGGQAQHSKPSKDDLRRLKQMLLNSCSVEASEV